MTVRRIIEITGDEGSVDRENVHEYTRRFWVQVDSYRDSTATVLAHRGIPKPYQPHPADPRALATKPKAKRRDDSSLWFKVTVPYSSQIDEEESDADPIRRRAKISMRSQPYKRIVLFDVFGNPIVNTAGDQFARPIEEDSTEWIFHVQKNITRHPRWLDDYDGALNSDSFRIRGRTIPKLKAKIGGLTISDYKIKNRKRYMELSFDIHYRQEGWHHEILNRGFRQLVEKQTKDPDTGKRETEKVLEEILIDGERSNDPLFLDKKGKHIAKPTKDNIVTLTFHTIKRKPFNVLPLK